MRFPHCPATVNGDESRNNATGKVLTKELGKARRVSGPVSQETCPVDTASTSEGEAPRPGHFFNFRTPSLLLSRGFFMSQIIFITGGARSGKSRLAEELAESFGSPLAYIATCEPADAEMEERIARHRERRGHAWQTIEEPFALADVVRRHDGRFNGILVDCITLWLTNLLLGYNDPQQVLDDVALFSASFPTLKTPLILVSSEVGMGIVPENSLARTFRDIAGEANELLAKAADEVYVMFSGLPLKLKG